MPPLTTHKYFDILASLYSSTAEQTGSSLTLAEAQKTGFQSLGGSNIGNWLTVHTLMSTASQQGMNCNWASSQENLSSGFPTMTYKTQPVQLQSS